MNRQLLELADELRSANDLDAFWTRAHRALEWHGVGSMFYGALASGREVELGRFSRSLIWKSSHKKEFFEAFGAEAALDFDPSVEHCVINREILFWHHDSDWRSVPPSLKKRVSIERDLGLHVGFSVPTSFFSPLHVGGIGLAMPDVPPQEFQKLWDDQGRHILGICGLLDHGMRQQHMAGLVRLSPREKECLSWLAAGLRPDQIADRLVIGSPSVEKYILGAKRKLKAATRDHAVAKALIFNIITP